MSVHIFSSPDELAASAAIYLANVIDESDRPITLGLAGGSTPAATYKNLARSDVDWSRVTMWLGDERWVPSDHIDSNTRMVRETFTDQVGGRLIAPDTSLDTPAVSAAQYSSVLVEEFHGGRPDVVLLGIGDDGHTASLFPDTGALTVDDATYLANWVEDKNTWRLTASLPLLHSARELVFIVQGHSKAAVLSEIIDRGRPYPAQQVAAGADNVRWMLDSDAAARLTSVPR